MSGGSTDLVCRELQDKPQVTGFGLTGKFKMSSHCPETQSNSSNKEEWTQVKRQVVSIAKQERKLHRTINSGYHSFTESSSNPKNLTEWRIVVPI